MNIFYLMMSKRISTVIAKSQETGFLIEINYLPSKSIKKPGFWPIGKVMKNPVSELKKPGFFLPSRILTLLGW